MTRAGALAAAAAAAALACAAGSESLRGVLDARATAEEAAALAMAGRAGAPYTHVRFGIAPRFTDCFRDLPLAKPRWMTTQQWAGVEGKPAEWYQLCAPRGVNRVQTLVDRWKKGLELIWAAFGTDADDAAVLKVAVWPEWNFRAAQDEDPLSIAEYQSIVSKITAIVSAEPYSKHSLIVPGTIFFGDKIVAAPSTTFAVTTGNLAKMPYADCAKFITTALPGKWAVFNVQPKWGNGVLRDTHAKYGEADALDGSRMVWGTCARQAVAAGAIKVGNDWSAVPDTTSTKVIVNGQHVGVDICVDHGPLSSVSGNLDRSWAPTQPLSIQVVVSTGQTLQLPSLKVKQGGYAVLSDGAGSLLGGQVALVTAVNDVTTKDPVPSAKTTTPVSLILHSTAAALAGDSGTRDITAYAVKLAGIKDQTEWAPLYDATEAWATVSAKLDL